MFRCWHDGWLVLRYAPPHNCGCFARVTGMSGKLLLLLVWVLLLLSHSILSCTRNTASPAVHVSSAPLLRHFAFERHRYISISLSLYIYIYIYTYVCIMLLLLLIILIMIILIMIIIIIVINDDNDNNDNDNNNDNNNNDNTPQGKHWRIAEKGLCGGGCNYHNCSHYCGCSQCVRVLCVLPITVYCSDRE